MAQETTNFLRDMRWTAKLTVAGVVGVTNIVEEMHQTVFSLGGLIGKVGQTRTKGVTGIAYKRVRAITEIVGSGLDVSLKQLGSMVAESDSSAGREAAISVLNGVLGDYLVLTNNPLAISMGFRREGKSLSDEALLEIIGQSNGKLMLMIHGSCMNDLQWNREKHHYGAALADDLGVTPLYLHYNSGLHISENGRKLADLLERLLAQVSQPIELSILSHSMGGLVARSACYYGESSGHNWLKHLKKMVFLGTPHHGALLERGGNWIDTLLGISSYSTPLARLGKIRSSGVTDLRYGNIVDEDWNGQDRFAKSGDPRTAVPLPEGVLCYALAGTIGKEASKLGDEVIGDGLVTVKSALGHHQKRQLRLLFPESQQWVGRGVSHFDLLSHPQVYETIKGWLNP